MKLEYLQKKYPEFIYESYSWELADDQGLIFRFDFAMGDIHFSPSIEITGVSKERVEALGKKTIDTLAFNIGLAEIPSYWKTACPPVIVVKAAYLDRGQASFLRDLIANMGQFFFENNLPFISPEVKSAAQKANRLPVIDSEFSRRFLVPMGGGKDSIVTLEVLREYFRQNPLTQSKTGDNIITFSLNANPALDATIRVAATRNISIERRIDPRLIELNKQGFFNGHTPFSSVLAFLGVAVAVLFDCRYVAISQERSSNEGNTVYLRKTVNHQYSKTIDFENKFRKYCQKFIVKKVDFFSFLRPLYELQIAMVFACFPQYFDVFLSCNKAYTLANRQNNAGWCCSCAKCLSVYAMLYPFVGEAGAVRIFGNDLFKNAGLLPLMRELLGEASCKPFECVGTFKEMRVALSLSLVWSERNNTGGLPILLQIFKNEYLPKYGNIEKDSQKILESWDGKNNLPKNLQNTLKNALKCQKGGGGLDKI